MEITFGCIKCHKKAVNFNKEKEHSVGICSACGAKQIIPKTNDDELLTLFESANDLLIDCDFYEASKKYEEIVKIEETQSEAYWGLVLCKYCVGYLDNMCACICPESSFTSVKDDNNYKKAKTYANKKQKDIIASESNGIDKSLKNISDIISSEKTFDVFISYKESDNDEQTRDSKEAKDIYDELTQKGLKVFYAPETLGKHNKIGVEYLASILAAVSSAKVMLVIGSVRDYFNSEWVKAEWSRFLILQEKADNKKRLIPCYMNMKLKDLPVKLKPKEAVNITGIGEKNALIGKVIKIVKPSLKEKIKIIIKNYIESQYGISKGTNKEMPSNSNNSRSKDGGQSEDKKDLTIEKKKKIIKIFVPIIAVLIAYAVFLNYIMIPHYNNEKIDYLAEKRAELPIGTIEAGGWHTVGLTFNGKAVATDDFGDGRCNLSEWKDIVAVSAGNWHTVGLKSDGTVVTVGRKDYGQCKVSEWKDIIAVSAGAWHTVGLKKDGTVVATGFDGCSQCDVSDWNEVVAISAGKNHTVGLRSDGTVVSCGDTNDDQCNVLEWKDIVEVSAGAWHTIGLKSDGTVEATGNNKYGQCDVSDWKDIVSISAGENHTVGLKKDGSVIAVGGNDYGQCEVSEWKDIVSISAGVCHTVGLKSDGKMVATKYKIFESGFDYCGQCDVSDWKDIKTTK